MDSTWLEIEGEPKPKGSVTAYAVKSHGGEYRGVVTHSAQSKVWERTIREQLGRCSTAMDGPLEVELWFYLTKPVSAKRKLPYVQPDEDKLIRAVLDALKHDPKKRVGLIHDDARVVNLLVYKRYATWRKPGVLIRVTQLEDVDDERDPRN